jgi:putative exporter of polyketide antibiotics
MSTLTGTGALIRLILRRDRVLLPLWVLLLTAVPVNFVAATEALYPTAADRLKYAGTSGTNPTFLAMYGPLSGTDVGSIVAQRVGVVPVMVALISLLIVIRHTRTEEEAGRRELVAAAVVGRRAHLTAALIVTMAANLLLAVLLAAGMSSQGLSAGGSVAFGLMLATAGCVFAAVAGVTAQLSQSAAAARGMAVAVLGGAFVVRPAGDVGGPGNGLSWLSWLSPFGWSHRLRPYAGERWWILAAAAGLAAVLVVAAVALSARRDVGAGIVQPRLGPADASRALAGPVGLAWRLHRGLLLGWLTGFAALGVVYGGVADGVKQMVSDNPELGKIFARLGGGAGIVDAYLASVMSIMALIASAYAVQATLRLRTEETGLRAEPVLATGTGRLRWAGAHLLFSALGSAAALAITGLTTGLVHGLNTGDVGRELPRTLAGAMVQLPAVWLLAAIAVALFGLLPRLVSAAWAALALSCWSGSSAPGCGSARDCWTCRPSPTSRRCPAAMSA